MRGSFDVANGPIDKKIQKTLEQEQAQERQQQIKNREPDQVFEKPVEEKTSKDAFTHAHDRYWWRERLAFVGCGAERR